jgi:hypothetical protein
MRFTLGHILAFHLACLFLIVANLLLGGEVPLYQGIVIVVVCAGGGAWGLWRHSRKHPKQAVPPMRPFVSGIAKAVALSALLGTLLGMNTMDVCTRTLRYRETWYAGPLCFCRMIRTEQTQIIEDELRYRPSEYHWTQVRTGVWHSYRWNCPELKYPQLGIDTRYLRILVSSSPTERYRVIFQWESPLDVELADLRRWMLSHLEDYLSDLGSDGFKSADVAVSAISSLFDESSTVGEWWRDYEPFLRPMRTPADMHTAIGEYNRRPRIISPWEQRNPNAVWVPRAPTTGDEEIESVVGPVAQRLGLPLPKKK